MSGTKKRLPVSLDMLCQVQLKATKCHTNRIQWIGTAKSIVAVMSYLNTSVERIVKHYESET